MRPSQVSVLFTETDAGVNAYVRGPFTPPKGRDTDSQPYEEITTPLEQRGLDCEVDFGLSSYTVSAALPDGSYLAISPPPARSAGGARGWLATRADHADSSLFEVVYDSQPDGAEAHSGESVTALLASVDERLDRLGVASRQQAQAVQERADSLLHHAGFVPVHLGERYHRLPVAMTDPAEQRDAVDRALRLLKAEGYDYAYPASLATSNPLAAPARTHQVGPTLAQMSGAISQAGHTREVVEALSELTAPGDGVLDQVVGVLDQAAAWWEGLGGSADPHYAARLRYITDRVDGYVREVRALRGDLADRHTAHPSLGRRDLVQAATPVEARVAAALAASPAAARAGNSPIPVPGPTAVPPLPPALRTAAAIR